MLFGQNLSDNVNHKHFGIIYFVSMSMHLDWFIKINSIIENDDELDAIEPKFIGQCESQIFWFNAVCKHVYAFRLIH